jgi:hypothetical protein|uniref:Uncharacterized protein n=1 Tax=Siphoviridae sp. ctio73 TaxID=2826435 RepID=A0A8S5MX32_9CAUD|nr:MAG TPA: hypothetical protein [Siphoviridae sp. ctio73]
MVNHTPPPFQHTERLGKKRREKRRREDKETQWCSGITCVLAGLRAHYPEHRTTKRKRKRKRRRRRTAN